MSTYAAAYSRPLERGMEPNVDLIHQTDDGEEAGWDNLTGAEAWTTDAADDLLGRKGWRRTSSWRYVSDMAGVPGWTADVERA